MASKKRHMIAKAAEIPPGQRKVVTIGRREIGVFNVGGQFYALRNICPHRGAPLCQGRIRPLMTSPDVYQLDRERDGEILKCPWHQWEFDIKTGQALYDASLRVKTYDARQEGDEVVVYV
jgi:3-phenylpropionate/trans-cinnamate dioxygenase ferredoxin subunit